MSLYSKYALAGCTQYWAGLILSIQERDKKTARINQPQHRQPIKSYYASERDIETRGQDPA